MTNVLALSSFRKNGSPAAPAADTKATKDVATLTRLLQEACREEGAILLPLLARMLMAHMRSRHLDASANEEIRDFLDEIQLLVCLEIERQGLRYGNEPLPGHQPSTFAHT
ncbi:hypothetical protein [Pseudoxanthomonas sp. UTMC 1351]|uniref:hypothetical protein n=1 Tax=Pseudoxanthomonas sp. UTMC 1351 TaxID=2695853 RepID=UPI0034CDDF4C